LLVVKGEVFSGFVAIEAAERKIVKGIPALGEVELVFNFGSEFEREEADPFLGVLFSCAGLDTPAPDATLDAGREPWNWYATTRLGAWACYRVK
jgi:hypothetical protein